MGKRVPCFLGNVKRDALGALFTRFVLSGAAGSCLHYSVFLILVIVVEVASGLAAFLGAVCGACVVYLLNRRYTFGSSVTHSRALPRFIILSLFGAILNGAVVSWLSHAGLHFLASQVTATLLVLIVNFVVSKKWIYR